MGDIAPVEELVETTAALVLASVTDKGGPVQHETRIVLGLEVFAGGIAEAAITAQIPALRGVTIANMTTVALAEQGTAIGWFIEMVMGLRDSMTLDLLGDGRRVLAQQRRDGGDRSSKRELSLNLAAVLKRQVLLVAGNKFTHNDAS